MKLNKILTAALACALVLAGCSRSDRGRQAGDEPVVIPNIMDIDLGEMLVLPENSSEMNMLTAMELLQLCSGGNEENTKKIAEKYGLETIKAVGYDKAADSAEHSCAYSVCTGIAVVGQTPSKITLIDIRGTSGGEWYANFDVSPNRNYNPDFSENFLYSAEKILNECEDLISDGIVVVCGHSRGAACANLLGVLLDELVDEKNLYVYTFATPGTINGDMKDREYKNIFNFINPGDIVTSMPLSCWGFERAGTDIVLEPDAEIKADAERIVNVLKDLAPDLKTYYEMRHSLTEAGEDEWGLTAFEVMLELSDVLAGANTTSDAEDFTGGVDGFDQIGAKSDLKPLVSLFDTEDEDNAGLVQVIMQHMQISYLGLMQKMAAM